MKQVIEAVRAGIRAHAPNATAGQLISAFGYLATSAIVIECGMDTEKRRALVEAFVATIYDATATK